MFEEFAKLPNRAVGIDVTSVSFAIFRFLKCSGHVLLALGSRCLFISLCIVLY